MFPCVIGTNTTIVESTENSMSALISFDGDIVNLTNSTIQNVTTTRDAVILLQTSTMSIEDSTFQGNKALLTGGIAAQGLASISVGNCLFLNNSGGMFPQTFTPENRSN